LEVLIGEAVCGEMQVLLTHGLDEDTEQRLSVCAAQEGSLVDGISDGMCVFAGHTAPKQAKVASDSCEDGANTNGQAVAGSGHIAKHGCAGLLSAPRYGKGLVLTLGPQPRLDTTHELLGRILAGRRAMRRLQALAPCSGGPQPRLLLTLLACAPPNNGAGEAVVGSTRAESNASRPVLPHPTLRLEPAKPSDRDCLPFSWEDEPASGPPPAELLEVAELEINGRDLELAELKQEQFSRERQAGVAAMEVSLAAIVERMERLGNLDETLAGQRSWQQERASHLLRILKKLR